MNKKLLAAGPALMVAGLLLRLLSAFTYAPVLAVMGIVLMAAGLVLAVRQHVDADGKMGQLFFGGMVCYSLGLILLLVGRFLFVSGLEYLAAALAVLGFVLMMLGLNRPDHRMNLKPFFDIRHFKNKRMVWMGLLWIVPGLLLILWGRSEYVAALQIAGLGFIGFGIYRVIRSQKLPDIQEIPDEMARREQDSELSGEVRSRQQTVAFLRIGCKILNAAGIIAGIVALFSESYWLILVICIICGLADMVRRHHERELKQYVSENIVRQALEEVFEIQEYEPFGAIPFETVRGSNMGIGSFNRTQGSDYIRGTYKGLPVELCDMELIEHVVSQDEDGNETESDHEVFRGLWLICDFGKQLAADMVLCERKNRNKILGGRGIRTDNEEFNRQFQVESQIEEEAFYILTPHMMEYILEMDRKAQGETHMRFERQGRVQIAIRKKHDSFEVGNRAMDATQLRKKFIQEIRYITDLIDELRLVDTLYRE